MNDPHVVALNYRITHGKHFNYDDAEEFEDNTSPDFCLKVKDKKVRFELKKHYATEDDAKASLKDFVRQWEFEACLEYGPDSFGLIYDDYEIIDRNPPTTKPDVDVILIHERISVSDLELTLFSGQIISCAQPVSLHHKAVVTMVAWGMGIGRPA